MVRKKKLHFLFFKKVEGGTPAPPMSGDDESHPASKRAGRSGKRRIDRWPERDGSISYVEWTLLGSKRKGHSVFAF